MKKLLIFAMLFASCQKEYSKSFPQKQTVLVSIVPGNSNGYYTFTTSLDTKFPMTVGVAYDVNNTWGLSQSIFQDGKPNTFTTQIKYENQTRIKLIKVQGPDTSKFTFKLKQ